MYVGDDDGARTLAGQGAEQVDLGGRLAVPGLCDAHMHAEWYALGLRSVQAETSTLAEALDRVRERAAASPAGLDHRLWVEP